MPLNTSSPFLDTAYRRVAAEPPNTFLQGVQAGNEVRRTNLLEQQQARVREAQDIENQLNQQKLELGQAELQGYKDAQTLQQFQRLGLAKISTFFSDQAQKGLVGDPATPAGVLTIASAHAIPVDHLKPFLDLSTSARNAAQMAAFINGGAGGVKLKPTINRDGSMSWTTDEPPAGIQYLDEAQKVHDQAEAARQAGDTLKYQQLTEREQAIRAMAPNQQNISFTQETPGGGRVDFSMGGAQSPKMTTAATTDIEKRNTQYASMLSALGSLSRNLRPQDVGAAGVGGEYLVDRALAQIVPEFANQERISNRAALVGISRALSRSLSEDTSRFSNADAAAVEAAAPSAGVLTSFPVVQGQLRNAQNIIRGRVRDSALANGLPIPDFAKSPEELQADYETRKSALQRAVEAKTLTEDQAKKLSRDARERTKSVLKSQYGIEVP